MCLSIPNNFYGSVMVWILLLGIGSSLFLGMFRGCNYILLYNHNYKCSEDGISELAERICSQFAVEIQKTSLLGFGENSEKIQNMTSFLSY